MQAEALDRATLTERAIAAAMWAATGDKSEWPSLAVSRGAFDAALAAGPGREFTPEQEAELASLGIT